MLKHLLFFFCLLPCIFCFSQREIKAVVADSLTKKPLPFATVQLVNQKNTVITEIDGKFAMIISDSNVQILVSYVGHLSKTINVSEIKEASVILLALRNGKMDEVVIRSHADKIKRIINTAIRNKPSNNPDLYERYECHVYYKMNTDILPFGQLPPQLQKRKDSLEALRQKGNSDSTEEAFRIFSPTKHFTFSESYSKRIYQRPQQLQEIILASRFSGLKKTYFSSVVTDVLPFHVYTDYINLNSVDYTSPLARGWQDRYSFILDDEVIVGKDTVFMFSFRPKKGKDFNSLSGMVYINSNNYAISHFIASTGDSTKDREIRFEQIYTFVNGKWFPKELNYDLSMRRIPSVYTQVKLNGHSVIDSIIINPVLKFRIDKTYPVKLSDSIDLHPEKDWQKFRKDSITLQEINTYLFMDSLAQEYKLEKLMPLAGKLTLGRLPVGDFDLDINRFLAKNRYEGYRLGAGIYTNDGISKYFSAGGWAGYGTKDKTWKYGASASFFFNGNKENSIVFSYQKNYRNPGESRLHPELEPTGRHGWLIGLPDEFKEYEVGLNLRKGYWEIRPWLNKQEVKPLYETNFEVGSKQPKIFTAYETGIGLRYAYGEKRIPAFGYYFSEGTKYPVFYTRISVGKISADSYESKYLRLIGGISYKHHLNRWGNDNFRAEAGMVYSFNEQPLPKSFLLAGKGFKNGGSNNYAAGGFLTMHPYDFFTDQYLAFFYKHDFDWFFWQCKYSKPFISVAHNMMYGTLNNETRIANANIHSLKNGYHESGILLNQVLKYNLHFGDINLNAGFFYHWNDQFKWKNNYTWVLGLSVGF